jgi:hypothetical protein
MTTLWVPRSQPPSGSRDSAGSHNDAARIAFLADESRIDTSRRRLETCVERKISVHAGRNARNIAGLLGATRMNLIETPS